MRENKIKQSKKLNEDWAQVDASESKLKAGSIGPT